MPGRWLRDAVLPDKPISTIEGDCELDYGITVTTASASTPPNRSPKRPALRTVPRRTKGKTENIDGNAYSLSRPRRPLKQAGLVRDRHEGRHTHYGAQPGALAPLIDWTS